MSDRIECSGCMCPACDDCFQQPETLNEFNLEQRRYRERLDTAARPSLFVATSHLERAQADVIRRRQRSKLS
jgi:hypothetical protein